MFKEVSVIWLIWETRVFPWVTRAFRSVVSFTGSNVAEFAGPGKAIAVTTMQKMRSSRMDAVLFMSAS